jgi:hypothetical protein
MRLDLSFILSVGIWTCGVQCENCQERLAILDDYNGDMKEKIMSAAELLSPDCLDFIRDDRLDREENVLEMKSMIGYVLKKLISGPHSSLSGDLRRSHQALLQTGADFLRTTDRNRLQALMELKKVISAILETGNEQKDPAGSLATPTKTPIVPSDVLEEPSSPEQDQVRTSMAEILIVSSGQGDIKRKVIVELEKTKEATIESEETKKAKGELDQDIAGFNRTLADLKNAVDLANRPITKGLPKSKDTVVYIAEDGKSSNLPCSQFLAVDGRDGRADFRDITPTCFNAIPDAEIRSFTPKIIANLRKDVFGELGFTTLRVLFDRKLLSKVPADYLAVLGKADPSVCGALIDDADKIDAITNLKNMNKFCLGAAPGWHYLIAKMGPNAPVDSLEGFTGKQIIEKFRVLADAELPAAIWTKAATKAEPPGLCQYLDLEHLEQSPSLAANLPVDCAEFNPSLAPKASNSFAQRSISFLKKTGSSAGINDATFEVILSNASLPDLNQIFKGGEFCNILSRNIAKVPIAKLGVIHNCPSIGLKDATDEQVVQLARDSGFCKNMTVGIVQSVLPSRYFGAANGTCIGLLSPEVISMTNYVDGDMESFPWFSIKPEHIGELGSLRISQIFQKLTKQQLAAIDPGQESIIVSDESLNAEYQKLRAKHNIQHQAITMGVASSSSSSSSSSQTQDEHIPEPPSTNETIWEKVMDFLW